MPNLFKRFSSLLKAEPYRFPDAKDLASEDGGGQAEKSAASETIWAQLEEEFGVNPEAEPEEAPEQEDETRAEPEPEKEESPLAYAQVQADMIVRDARRQAEDILAKARLDAELETERIRSDAREEGRLAGYQDGLTQGRLEAAREREEQAAIQEEEVNRFLEQAGAELDRRLDESVGELRDLAMAIAEKVVCVSLKSSADVICRMIQTAIDKKKRREWVHIYIAECDAKRLGQLPASLASALSALSGRVRIIPMAEDESGTCIIETPDEIIDASANTQLNNIRTLLMDAASSAGDGSLF